MRSTLVGAVEPYRAAQKRKEVFCEAFHGRLVQEGLPVKSVTVTTDHMGGMVVTAHLLGVGEKRELSGVLLSYDPTAVPTSRLSIRGEIERFFADFCRQYQELIGGAR